MRRKNPFRHSLVSILAITHLDLALRDLPDSTSIEA